MELTPETLDAFLTVARAHRVRAIKVNPDGSWAAELEPDAPGPAGIDIPEDVAGGWKRPANLDSE